MAVISFEIVTMFALSQMVVSQPTTSKNHLGMTCDASCSFLEGRVKATEDQLWKAQEVMTELRRIIGELTSCEE